jgi:phosphoglycerol transferase MdoB-like AlkP superfamily enzyme
MIDNILQTLYNLPFAAAIRVDYFWFPFFETIHVITISLVVGTVFIVDLRLLGLTSNRKPVTELSREVLPWTWGAFGVAVIAGSMMFISKATNYYDDDFFRYKMVLILLAGLNMAVFHLFTYKSVAQWDRDVPPRLGARIAGGLSIACWILVVFCGRWVGFTVL